MQENTYKKKFFPPGDGKKIRKKTMLDYFFAPKFLKNGNLENI